MYIGTQINDSPTITAKANAAISSGEFLAAKFTSGKVAKCSVAGEHVVGIIIAGQDSIAADADVTLQIKDIGLWTAGAAIAVGAELTTDANGKAAIAGAGDYVFAVALQAASAAGSVIKIQIINAGYKPDTVAMGDITDVDLSTAPTNGQILKYNTTSQKWEPSADATN